MNIFKAFGYEFSLDFTHAFYTNLLLEYVLNLDRVEATFISPIHNHDYVRSVSLPYNHSSTAPFDENTLINR